jgi:hypothetical protein
MASSSSSCLLAMMLVALACCGALVPLTHAQIYETVCRDANCTDVALGPLALIPQCYRTQQGSIRLSINESDRNRLDLCFYAADDCPPLDGTAAATNGGGGNVSAAAAASSCHSFVNGQTCDCPFLRGMNSSLYVRFTWDADNIKLLQDLIEIMPSYQRSKRQILNNFFGLAEFGNWCGSGHGGTRDCCNGQKCSQCNYNQGLTTSCLRQCPARDQLDMACAVHDFCTTNYDYERILPAGSDFSCSALFGTLQGDYCACDCQLVRSARRVTSTNSFYRSSLIFLFTHVTSCWYQSNNGPVCNRGDDRRLVTEFCN